MSHERPLSRRALELHGRAFVKKSGISLKPGERIRPFGTSWLICDDGGFVPCPWAFEIAERIRLKSRTRLLDLGCGVGSLLLAMADIHGTLEFGIGIERQARALDQARRNIQLSGHKHLSVVRADVRSHVLGPHFDLVVCNPPFYPPGWGRVSARQRVAEATHAFHGGVNEFALAAKDALAPKGQVIMVFDASRVQNLILAMDRAALTIAELSFLEDDRGKFARVVATAGGECQGLKVHCHSFSGRRST